MSKIEKTLKEFKDCEEIEIVVDEGEITEELYELAHSFGFNVEVKDGGILSFTKMVL